MLGKRRRKSAFQQSNFWDNAGIIVLSLVGFLALWFLMTSVIKW
jgi:CDR ABC transporter